MGRPTLSPLLQRDDDFTLLLPDPKCRIASGTSLRVRSLSTTRRTFPASKRSLTQARSLLGFRKTTESRFLWNWKRRAIEPPPVTQIPPGLRARA